MSTKSPDRKSRRNRRGKEKKKKTRNEIAVGIGEASSCQASSWSQAGDGGAPPCRGVLLERAADVLVGTAGWGQFGVTQSLLGAFTAVGGVGMCKGQWRGEGIRPWMASPCPAPSRSCFHPSRCGGCWGGLAWALVPLLKLLFIPLFYRPALWPALPPPSPPLPHQPVTPSHLAPGPARPSRSGHPRPRPPAPTLSVSVQGHTGSALL